MVTGAVIGTHQAFEGNIKVLDGEADVWKAYAWLVLFRPLPLNVHLRHEARVRLTILVCVCICAHQVCLGILTAVDMHRADQLWPVHAWNSAKRLCMVVCVPCALLMASEVHLNIHW